MQESKKHLWFCTQGQISDYFRFSYFSFFFFTNRMKQAATGGAVAVAALGVIAGVASVMMNNKK